MDKLTLKIKLVGGAIVEIPRLFKYEKCRGCEATDIIWAKTKNDRWMPIHWVEPEGYVSHFSDCPSAGKFRKK